MMDFVRRVRWAPLLIGCFVILTITTVLGWPTWMNALLGFALGTLLPLRPEAL